MESSARSGPSLCDLSVDLMFTIFKKLDRPSKISLALSNPGFLQLFAKYYDLDRYRDEPQFSRKLGVPRSISWEDPQARGAILRWMAMPGGDDIDEPSHSVSEEEEDVDNRPGTIGGFDGLGHVGGLEDLGLEDESLPLPYEETAEGKEEEVVQRILEQWLEQKCGITGGVVFCAECYRFMRLRPEDGRRPWCRKMLTRGL